MQGVSKNFFLISFLPAIAYWYLEANYPIRIAIAGGLLLAILEIILEKVFTKHVHGISKFNFFLILFLGVVSFLGEEGIWFKLQPAFTGLGIGFYLLVRILRGDGLLIEMQKSMNPKNSPPDFVLNDLEKHLSVFFVAYGLFMIFVATTLSTDHWLFFKTLGFYLIFGMFFVLELVLLRRKMKTYLEGQKQWNYLSNIRVGSNKNTP